MLQVSTGVASFFGNAFSRAGLVPVVR